MGVGQRLQHVVVLTVDDRVERFVAATLHFPRADQARIDRVAELGHDHQVIQRDGLRFGFSSTQKFQVGHLRRLVNGLNLPQALVTLLGRAAFRQHAHLAPLADGAQRQLHGFRAVTLEIQAKWQP